MIKTCRAGGTDEKTQWSNLLVCILSEIEYVEDTRTRKLFGAKKILGGRKLSRILRNDFSRIDLYSLKSGADSDSFQWPNGNTVISLGTELL